MAHFRVAAFKESHERNAYQARFMLEPINRGFPTTFAGSLRLCRTRDDSRIGSGVKRAR